VVYLVGSGDAGDPAFDEACAGADAGCTPLWSMSADNGGTVNFGSVTDDALYVGGLDGNLHVDALLSDVIMPGMSGTQLAAELRQTRPELPVLFMSGYTSGPAPGGQELPPDAPLLHKPFQNDQLLQAMSQLLERPPG